MQLFLIFMYILTASYCLADCLCLDQMDSGKEAGQDSVEREAAAQDAAQKKIAAQDSAQKAAVVAMVKNGLDVMTLSIGDGANDVAMIQEADVGVGIAGVEGRQAAMSSDYAIAQFRFLQRLVLVHGRWSYRRLAESISNFFYKNIVWTFAIFWYEIFCDFDITYIFEYSYILLFNLVFTSLPVGLLGVFDQDVSDKVSLAVPQLYRRGIERLEWTQTKFW